MGRLTIVLLQRISPETRRIVAAYIFWLSIILGVYCTIYISKTKFERILMAISWLAVTVSAVDVIFTADVRVTEDEI